MKPKHNIDLLRDKIRIDDALEKTKTSYRKLDPGWYLYRKILEYKINDKFNTEFIELCYVTLSAWNMNSRGAKLQDFEMFEKSIINNKQTILALSNFTLKGIENNFIKEKLYSLFNELNLVAEGKPMLVTFSKTMHFFLPNLIGPIDRKYTLNYFFNSINVPKNRDIQFEYFWFIQTQYKIIAEFHDFENIFDNYWNGSIPKIIDNIVIGVCKLNSKSNIDK